MRLALGYVAACAAAFAQSGAVTFSNLATTDDGSNLYFSSTKALAGVEESPHARIFVYGPQGLHLFAHQDEQNLAWPAVTGDASAVAFTATSDEPRANLATGSGAVYWTGSGRVSIGRNPRFALFITDPKTATVMDFGSLTRYSFALESADIDWGGRKVAADGTTLIPGSDSIRIMRATGMKLYPAQGAPKSAVIDDQAATVAYETQGRIVLLDLTSGTETIAADPGAQPRLSNDGRVLLYLAPDANGARQVWVRTTQLTAEADGVTEAVLSGDGSTAYAVVNSARILHIDVASGRVDDLTDSITRPAPSRPRVVSMTVNSGQLCYQVENVTQVSILPGFGVVSSPATCLGVQPAMTTTYTLTASNEAGTATASATAAVGGAVAITSFSNDPPYSPISGGPVNLTWTTQNAGSVVITGLGVPPGTLPPSGTVTVNPVTNTTYTLIAYGANGSSAKSVLYVFVR